ncbi:MAG TPA: universal stress protein [Verrucomicrobiae bacterium]|jgi:nucleotide-binding universal stress UspA family protein|nr:universal stress protein [Verrucomicrobiae bacterium]
MQTTSQSSFQPGQGVPSPTLQFKKVLAPVDFSERSQNSLRYTVKFARQHDSKLILLHVVEPVMYPAEEGVATFVSSPVDSTCEPAKAKPAQWKNTEIRQPITVEIMLRRGPAYNENAEAAKEIGVDLIIISTHGYTGLKHVLMGSTAKRVVRHAPCPILAIRQTIGS